jgi:hypothetical protein
VQINKIIIKRLALSRNFNMGLFLNDKTSIIFGMTFKL